MARTPKPSDITRRVRRLFENDSQIHLKGVTHTAKCHFKIKLSVFDQPLTYIMSGTPKHSQPFEVYLKKFVRQQVRLLLSQNKLKITKGENK